MSNTQDSLKKAFAGGGMRSDVNSGHEMTHAIRSL